MDKKEQIRHAEQHYSGAAVDVDDKRKVTRKMVDDETKELNNNPRNNDL